jgi:hypothetical protein
VEEYGMAIKLAEVAPHLSEEARKAVNEAFDAISTWRSETLSNSEKNSEQVLKKMAAAARALGWPEQIVEATHEQLQNVTKMQIETSDRMMDVWEEQIKSPHPMAASSAMLSTLKSLPSFGGTGNWPNADALQKAGMNPLQLYTQMMSQWQKAWTDAMSFWAKGGRSDDTAGPRRR